MVASLARDKIRNCIINTVIMDGELVSPFFLYENLNKDCIKIALFTLFIEFTLQKDNYKLYKWK